MIVVFINLFHKMDPKENAKIIPGNVNIRLKSQILMRIKERNISPQIFQDLFVIFWKLLQAYGT
jgi:hypothetical protein